jgi:preprotein translocase subunit Sec61beta
LGGDSGSSSGSSFGSSGSSYGSSYESSSYEGSSYDDEPAPSSSESNYGYTEQSNPAYGIPPSSSTIGTSYGPDPSAAGATGTASVGSSSPLGRAVRSAKNTMQAAAARGPRRARLQLRRIDPWSVLKFSLAVSAVLLIVFVVATTAIYVVLWSMGVFDAVNNTIKTFTAGDNSGSGVDLTISPQLVIGGAAVIGLINVVLFSALATIGSFIYNVCADLVGGIEITLAERD